MKYLDLYPDSSDGDEVEPQLLRQTYLWDGCMVCGDDAPFLDVDEDVYVCSDECRSMAKADSSG